MKLKKSIYYLLPIVGTILCLWYIKEATCDIVYSDYIRIVNKYLPDIWSRENFFRPDVLTRIPICYVARIINVIFFHYNTTFDMGLGVLGLGLSGLVLGRYCSDHRVNMIWYVFLTFVLFGLNKWEMLTNGTGWVHFLAFACFYYHYLVFDRVLYGREKRWDRVLLVALAPVITLGIAGPYCAVYSAVMIVAYAGAWLFGRWVPQMQKEGKPTVDLRFCLVCIVSVLIPLLLYMWSNSYAYEDHDGAIKVGLVEMFLEMPGFFPRFLLNSLASMVIEGEMLDTWIGNGVISYGVLYLLGSLLAAGYLLALWMNLRYRLYERTVYPMILLLSGMGNHAIILISRYIFGREDYGMSSRYALQYQVGLIGIILTFTLLWKELRRMKGETGAAVCRGLACAFCVMILAGHGYTDYLEIKKAPYREAYGENIAQVAIQYESVSDDVLRETFDYRKGRETSGADVRRALRILKENGWNVFSRQ